MGSISAYLRRNVLGLVAIFLALNAGAYAITSDEGAAPRVIDNQGLRTGSVDSRVLATNAVTTPDIAPRTVGPRKIKLDNLVRYLRNEANLSCPSGEVVQSVSPDGHVTCTPAGGNGTITGISTSGGLTGGGSAGDVALGVDPSQIQSRVTGSCSGNEAVQSVGQGGGVGCGAIDAAGAAGGDLTGSYPNPTLGNGVVGAANIDPAEVQNRVTGSCSGNEAVQSVGQGGGVGCGAITANGAAGGDLSGSYPNPTLGNGVVDAANFASLPGGKMVQTTCQTFPNGGIGGVDFDALSYGQGVTFDDANDTLTVSTAGTYLVTAYAEWAQNGSGDRALVFDTSAGAGTSGFDSRNAVPQTTQGQTATQLVHLPAGTSLTVSAGQGSGGDLSLVDLGANCASLSVQWLAP
jgi:hypothetical protein